MKAHRYPAGCLFSSLNDIRNNRITIMGLGRNGGGCAAAQFFLRHGAYVTVTDMKDERELAPTIAVLESDHRFNHTHLTYHLGGHNTADFSNADCVIKNPGIRYDNNEYLAAARAIETDISVFLALSRAPIIAVTGSKGKSSTVSAIHYGLSTAGIPSFLGGNITVSPLSFLEQTNEHTPVILELSSWQLADLRGRNLLKPHIAVITKIVPDHLNWYDSMEAYVADKRLIYSAQTESDFSIFYAGPNAAQTGQSGSWEDSFATETHGTVLRYGTDRPDGRYRGAWIETDGTSWCGKILLPDMAQPETVLTELSVPGTHMRENALAAALVMAILRVPASDTARILASWPGTAHRLQHFHTAPCGGRIIRFYNDSCATVPEAAAAAVAAFDPPCILIAGGTDKALDFTPLANMLAAQAKQCTASYQTVTATPLYLLAGSGTDKLTPLLAARTISYNGPYETLPALLAALKEHECTAPSNADTVVFSPGATSFGMFANEFDRGNRYMELVKKIFPAA